MTRRPKSARRFRKLIDDLALTQMDAARFLRRGPRSIRRWASGDDVPPFAERALLELMVDQHLSVATVERIMGARR
jgi:DNA-binding transcriptional regulator YiaG